MSEAWPYLLLLAAAVIPYVGIVRHGYFLTDDFGALYMSERKAPLDLLSPSFYRTYGTFGFFRPAGILLWMANYRLYGFDPVGYHLTNLLLHAAATLTVFLLVRELSGDRPAGLIAGLVFAVHPAHSQAVAWISSRYDLLATFFYLAGLLLYVRLSEKEIARWKFFAVVIFLEFMALLSKESALTFPAAILLYEVYKKRRITAALARSVPYLLVCVSYLLLRRYFLDGIGYGWRFSLPSATEAVERTGQYVKTLFLGYDLRQGNKMIFVAAASVVSAVSLLLFLRASRERKRLLAFFVALVLVNFLPLVNFTEVTDDLVKSSRYMYLPSVGFSGVLGQLLTSSSSRGLIRKGVLSSLAVVVLVTSLITLHNNNGWKIAVSDQCSSILDGFRKDYPTLDGVDLVMYNFPLQVFGDNEYKPRNIVRALYFAYGGRRMDYKLSYFDIEKGSPVRLPLGLDKKYTRKVVLTYSDVEKRTVAVYDSQRVKKP